MIMNSAKEGAGQSRNQSETFETLWRGVYKNIISTIVRYHRINR